MNKSTVSLRLTFIEYTRRASSYSRVGCITRPIRELALMGRCAATFKSAPGRFAVHPGDKPKIAPGTRSLAACKQREVLRV